MSTAAWPPLSAPDLRAAEEASLANELRWLLSSLQTTLKSLSSGLDESLALLQSSSPSTLPLSTPRSETLKGTITRLGPLVTKASITLHLTSLPTTPYTLALPASAPPFPLQALSTAATRLRECLDVVDVSRWGGDATSAPFIAGQLRLLQEHVAEAKGALTGPVGGREAEREAKVWLRESIEPDAFEPALPSNLALHVHVVDASVVVTVRTVADVEAGGAAAGLGLGSFGFREGVARALGVGRKAEHDEAEEVVEWRGKEVRVREKVRVESQDPSLMAALAKLAALEHTVLAARRALGVVMGEDEGEES
ncbi:MAG: hypothetical protein M1814_002876 [Vezdaea aestivalis]|nr:MAG: hypothetical protein M1814_002876 [Vezdaea aestivalis]